MTLKEIDFNSRPICLQSFYAERLGNHIHHTCIFAFLCTLMFLHMFKTYLYLIVTSIWPIDRTLTGTTTPGQHGPASNGNEVKLHTIQSWTSIRGNFVSYRKHSFFEGVLSFRSGYSQHVLNSTNRACDIWLKYTMN